MEFTSNGDRRQEFVGDPRLPAENTTVIDANAFFLLTRFLGTYGFPAFQPVGKPECCERELSNFLPR